MTVSSSAQPVQLMCIHQCNSDELQLFNNDKPLRSGQEAILHCEAFGGNPRATLHWLRVGLCIYLSIFYNTIINLLIYPSNHRHVIYVLQHHYQSGKGWRED